MSAKQYNYYYYYYYFESIKVYSKHSELEWSVFGETL